MSTHPYLAPVPMAATSTSASPAPRKRRGLACERCRSRKQKCLPGSGSKCRNCQRVDAPCEFLEKSAYEIHLQRQVGQLQARIHELETVLSSPTSVQRAVRVDLRDGQSSMGGASSVSPSTGTGDPEADRNEDNLAAGVGFLSLNGGAEPLYLGGSSGIGWAKVLMSSIRQKTHVAPRLPRQTEGGPSETRPHTPLWTFPMPAAPSESLGNHYISTVYQRIQSRYGFLDWIAIQGWQSRAAELCLLQPLDVQAEGGLPSSERVDAHYGAFFLWMLYGLGNRLCEQEVGTGVSHEIYYNAAIRHFAQLSTIKSVSTVQALLLLIVYTFRHTSSGLSLWHTGGMAIRSAIELGLHRRIRSKAEREGNPRAYCMRQRVWWGAYILDRMIAMQFGRPFACQDRDIDIELPVNLDANIADNASLCSLLEAQANFSDNGRPGDEYRGGYGGFSSMTSFIHTIRLNQLKSKIHDLMYTVDRPHLSTIDEGSVNGLLQQLDGWRSVYPLDPDIRVPACTHDFFELEYHNCVQLLLRPLTAKGESSGYFLHMCANSAAAVLDIECRLLRQDSKNLATWVLYKIFMSGLTLLHVIWNHPEVLPTSVVSRGLRACSTCLFIYAQQFSTAGAYLDCFEDLVKAFDDRQEGVGHSDQGVRNDNGLATQTEIWSERLDTMGELLPGLREDVAMLINQPGVNPEVNAQPFAFQGLATPATVPLASADPMGDMLWDLPFDAWTGDHGMGFPGLFTTDRVPTQGTGQA